MRAGEFRICPRCQTRNKATQETCVQCGRELFGIVVSRTDPLAVEAALLRAGPTPAWMRWAVGAGILIALGSGLFVRRIFRTSLEPSTTVPAAEAEPSPTPPTAPPPTTIAQTSPNSAVAAHDNGRALWASGSRDRAVVEFERAARIDPQNSTYRVDLGKALAALRRTREAIREYEAAVSLDPGNADTVVALASLYQRSGNGAESRALLQRAALLRPGDADIARRLGEANVPPAPPATSAAPPSLSPPPPSASSASSPERPPPEMPTPASGSASASQSEDARVRQRVAERRRDVRALEQGIAAMTARIADLRRAVEAATGDESRQDLERQLTEVAQEVDQSRERLAAAQRRLEDAEDEARRKGVVVN